MCRIFNKFIFFSKMLDTKVKWVLVKTNKSRVLSFWLKIPYSLLLHLFLFAPAALLSPLYCCSMPWSAKPSFSV